VVSRCSIEYPPGFSPTEGVPHAAEQKAKVWTNAALRVTNELSTEAGRIEARIRGVAVSSLVGGLNVPVDRDFDVLRPVPIWLDRRATEEASAAAEVIDGEHLLRVTGNGDVTPYFGFTKLLWYMVHDTERFRRTRALLTPNGMVVNMLTDQHVTDLASLAAFGGVLDVSKGRVDEDLLSQLSEVASRLAGEDLAISPDLFGRVVPCDEVVGFVTASGAGLSSLPEKVPVVASGLDAPISMLAAGGREPGDNVLMMGTSWSLGVLSDRASHNPVPGMLHVPHVVDGERLVFSMTGGPYTGGSAGFWMPDMVVRSSFEKLEREAKLVEPGSDGVTFLPYLMGDRTPLGHRDREGAFLGLRATHSSAHMFRAVLEGGVLLHEECLEDAQGMGVALKTTRVVDGAYRSSMWRSILADMTGRPLLYDPDFHGIAYGDAMLAAMATGLVTMDQAFKWLPPSREIAPTGDQERLEAYARARQRYDRYRRALGG
jgi:xylulokinase